MNKYKVDAILDNFILGNKLDNVSLILQVEPLKLYYVVYDIKNKRRKVEKLECPAERPLSTDPITNTEAVQEATGASASVGKSSTDPDVLTSTVPALATSEKPDVTITAGPDATGEPETATGASESEMLDVEVMNAGATPGEEKSSSDVVIPGSKSDSPIIIEDSEMSSPEKKDTDVPAVAIAVTTPSDIDAQAVLLPLPTPPNKEGETNVLLASESEIPIHDNKAPSDEQSVNVALENREGTPPAEDQMSLEHCVDRSEKENVPTDVEPVCVSIQNKSDCLTKISTENDVLVIDETAKKHPSVNSKVLECTKDVSSETPSTAMQDTIIKQDVIAKENVSNMKETVLVAKDETAQISKDSVFSGKPYGKPKTNTKEAKKTMSSLIAELVKNKTKMAPVPIRPKELCSSVVTSHLTTSSQSGCVQTQANVNGTPALCKDSQAQQTLKKRNGSSSNFVALSRNAVRKNDISCQQSFANQTIPSAITSIPQINTVVTSSPPISTAVTSSLLSTFQTLQKSLPIGASNNNATSVLKKSCSVQNRTIVAQRGVNSGSNIHHQKRKSSPVKNSLKGDQIGIPVSMAYLNLPLSVRNGKETYIQISQIGSSKVTTISTEATSSSSNAPHSTCSSPQSPDQTPSPAQTPPTLTSSQSPSGGQISPARMTQLIVPNPLSPTQSVTSKSRKEQTSVSRRVSPGGATFATTAAQLAGLGPQITMTPVSSAVTQTNTSAREVVAKGDMTMAQLLSAATVATVPRRNQNSVMRAQLSTPKSHLAQPSNKRSPSNQSEKRTKQRDLRSQGFGNALINDIQQQANQMFTRFPTCYQAPPASIKIQKAHQAQLHSKYPGAILSVPTYSGREYNVRYNYMSPKPTHTVPQVSSDDMPQDLSIKKNKKDDNFNNRNSTMDHMEVAGDN